jgi:hypothetical protein
MLVWFAVILGFRIRVEDSYDLAEGGRVRRMIHVCVVQRCHGGGRTVDVRCYRPLLRIAPLCRENECDRREGCEMSYDIGLLQW